MDGGGVCLPAPPISARFSARCGFVPYEVSSYPAFVPVQRLGFLALVVDPAYDDFPRLFVAGLAVELEQPQIIAVGSFLPGRRDEVCPELGEQLAERFEVLVPL